MSVPESDKKEIDIIPVLQGVVSVILVGIGHFLVKYTKKDLAEFLSVIIIISPFISLILIQLFVRKSTKPKRVLNKKISKIQLKGNEILGFLTDEEKRLRDLLKEEAPDSSIRPTLQKNISKIINKRQATIDKMTEEINQC